MDEEITKDNPPTIRRHEPEDGIEIKIPICCQEGWDDCPHRVERKKPKKQNIGL